MDSAILDYLSYEHQEPYIDEAREDQINEAIESASNY